MVRINRKVLCAAAAVAIGLLHSVESQPQSANESDLSGNPSANDNPANVAAPRIEFEPFEDEVDPELEATDEVKVPPKKQELFDMDLMMSPLLSQMPKSFRRHYCYFLFYCVGMLVYGWIGYETNKQRVKRVIAALKPVLQENFAFIADEPHCYEALRWHKFQAYASGRTSCDRLFIDFDLVKRQCMWHRWVFRHMFRMEDTMTIEMMLPKMDCIVFAITHKMTNKLFIKKNQEVANTTYVLDSSELPPTHRAYINGTEKCFAKYASYVIAACQEFMPHLIHFYAADAVPEAEGYRQWRQIVLKVRVGDDDQLAAKVLAAAIHIADYTKNYTVMDKTREAMTKARQDMIAVLFKAEIKRQKEEAKEAKEESKLTPEKIKKLEKKALARPTPRVKVIR
ncbi:membrane protein, putative [Babesia bigemina]|uniref:Membrane protein, putative n=1 Tax=Babesia bigemina TaxID=5866 RepID=A0A061D7U6_BABBI|nr:membrane protein, putative [Babesia bigemina]CDR96756.1 membrane protein, putative [Babesia bigemina]|eukprot:XP_012768942.1 membrane protein, putative [Babesia bigemina]